MGILQAILIIATKVFQPYEEDRKREPKLPSPSKLFTITVQERRLLEKFCGTLSFIEIEQVLFFK